MNSGKKRNYLFDNIKVLLIFFVVSTHFLRVRGSFNPQGIDGIYYIIGFSFIMQGFFFISGYFSKNVIKCHERAIKNFLLPYFLLTIVMYCLRHLLYGHASLNFLVPSHALWFLLVMFTYRFGIFKFKKFPHLLAVSFILYLFCGCFDFFNNTLAFGRLASFLVFFVAGFYTDETQIEKLRAIPKKHTLFLLVFLTGISIFLAVSKIIPVEMWHLAESFHTFHISNLEGVIIRCILILLSVGWLIVIFNLMPDHQLSFSYVGKYTMEIYVFHLPIRCIIKYAGIPCDSISSLILCFYLAFLTTLLFSGPKAADFYNKSINICSDILCVPKNKLLKKGLH